MIGEHMLVEKLERHGRENDNPSISQIKPSGNSGWGSTDIDSIKYENKQNINTLKTHFSIKNLYLPHSMKSELELERHIMDIFYKRYDMPLKYSRLFRESQSERNSLYSCRIGFKYVTDAVKLFDKSIDIDFKLFPFKSVNYNNFEPSDVFHKYVILHKERMKMKGNIMIPSMLHKSSPSKTIKKRDMKTYRGSSYDRDREPNNFHLPPKDKTKTRKKKSRSSSNSSNRSFIRPKSDDRNRKKKIQNQNITEEVKPCSEERNSCYLLGLAENHSIVQVSAQLKRKSIKEPIHYQSISKIEDGFNCNYHRLVFDSSRYVEKLVDQGIEMPNNNLLILPNLEFVRVIILIK